MTFSSVTTLDQIPPGTAIGTVVDGAEVVIANCAGTLHALDNVCSHAYAHLHEGELDEDDCTITCPLHGAVFSLETGKPRTLPAVRPVAVYAVQLVGDDVQVAVR